MSKQNVDILFGNLCEKVNDLRFVSKLMSVSVCDTQRQMLLELGFD
jgi:hypothetical protein